MTYAVRRLPEARRTLKLTFQTASEASIEAKLTLLQEMKFAKSESVVDYSSRILGLVSELESAGPKVTNIKKRRALSRGLPKEFDVTSEAVVKMNDSHIDAVLKLILRETRLKSLDNAPEQVLLTKAKMLIKCFKCGRKGHFARECR